jgi:Flp pilus assembly protein TadB
MNDISTACEHDKLRNKIAAIMMGIKIQAVIVTVGPQQR